MGLCFERMGDPWQAERLMTEAAALLDEPAGPFEAAVTQNNLAQVALATFLLMRDTGHELECRKTLDRALQYAQAARVHAQALGDPFVLAIAEGNCARALLYSGRLDEAESLLDRVLQQHGRLRSGHRGQAMQCVVAEALLARGLAREALVHAQATLADPELTPQDTDSLRLHRTAYRAAQALGEHELALRHLERCHEADRRRAVTQLMAQARYLATRIEAHQQAAALGAQVAAGVALDSDPVTGLGNRELLAARMPEMLRMAEQREAPLTVALVDVDHFKPMRARFGTGVANQVLQALAQMLRENTRGADLLLRWDTDQFLVVLPDTVPDRAFEVCERLRLAVESHDWPALAAGLDVTLSVGLAHPPPHATDVLIARARSAMQRAKHLGRNRVALA
jgi:diguanylate cyclase (GGDEF)-like protein